MNTKRIGIKTSFLGLFRLIRKRTCLVIPFFSILIFEVTALICIYFSPRYPLSRVFAPPIRKFWGEQYLHYPQNFNLIPRLYNYAHILLAFTVGIIMSAIFIKMCHIAYKNEDNAYNVKLAKPAILLAIRKYIPLVIIFAFAFLVTLYSFSFIGGLVSRIGLTGKFLYVFAFFVNFTVGLILQSVFVVFFPVLIVGNLAFFKALKEAILFLCAHWRQVVTLVFIPSLLYGVISINKLLLPWLMNRYEPEILLVSISFGIIISVIVDFFITGLVSTYYIMHHVEKDNIK